MQKERYFCKTDAASANREKNMVSSEELSNQERRQIDALEGS